MCINNINQNKHLGIMFLLSEIIDTLILKVIYRRKYSLFEEIVEVKRGNNSSRNVLNKCAVMICESSYGYGNKEVCQVSGNTL